MLILTRRLNEKLTIGREITVTVLGIKGNQVRLGISAPQSVEVHCEEITIVSVRNVLAVTHPKSIPMRAPCRCGSRNQNFFKAP